MRLPGSDVGKSGDRIERPEPDGSERVYSDRTTRDEILRVLRQYRLPITALVAVVLVGSGLGLWSLPDVPPEIRSAAIYALVGSVITLPAGYYLVVRLRDERGVEVLDLDPVSDDHRHLRIGPELWDSATVVSPWGEETGTEDLRVCSINGRTGYVAQDVRVDAERGLIVVSSTVGELSSVELETYSGALEYVRSRLARRANRAVALRGSIGLVAQEAAERVVVDLVRESETSGVPSGDKIQQTVEEVVGGLDLDRDGLSSDRTADLGQPLSDLKDRDGSEQDVEQQTNGHGDGIPDAAEDLGDAYERLGSKL